MGTKIQGLMQYTAVREALATQLGRRPSFAEWAESCCMTEPELKVGVPAGMRGGLGGGCLGGAGNRAGYGACSFGACLKSFGR